MYSRHLLNENFRDGFLIYNDILQCVHGVYDEKMEAVYRKSSRKGSFGEDTESTLLRTLGIFYSEDSGNALFRFFVNLFFFL